MSVRSLVGTLLVAVPLLAPVSARANPIMLVCVVAVSSTTWTLTLDLAARTANGHPANVSDQEVTWYNPLNGSHNTLNRVSGFLTTSNAAPSTCRPGQKQF